MPYRMFFLVCTCIGAVGTALVWLMYRTGLDILKPYWTLAICMIAPILFGVSNIYLNSLPIKVTRYMAWIGGVWMGFIFFSFLLLTVFIVLYILGRITGWSGLAPIASQVLLAVAVVATSLGVWQTLHPNVRRYTFRTYKSISQSYRIAFVSDLHFGALFGNDHGNKLAALVNQEDPDLIILGGDIIDRDLYFALREGSLKTLRKMKAPQGIFAVMGNHDLAGGTSGEERAYLENMGIHFLINDSLPINKDIWMTGLDDYRLGNRNYTFHVSEPDKLNIFVEHEPVHITEASKKGFDIYLAGHTHGGQTVPLNLVIQRMFMQIYGTQARGNMLTTVTSGFGLSGMPLRLGVPPEIIIITVEPGPLKKGNKI
jgi:predicted MPP superfamily phosphohydrolase